MDILEAILANPIGLLAVVCLVGVFVIANLALIAMIGGGQLDLTRWRRSLSNEAALWQKSFTGGREAQRQQSDQLDELHRLVGQLGPPEDKPASASPDSPPAPHNQT